MKRLFIYFVIAVLFSSCFHKKKIHIYATPQYIAVIYPTQNKYDHIPVSGNVIFEEYKGIASIVTKDSTYAQTDENGNFKFNVKEGRYRFSALSIAFKPVDARKIKLKKGDSLILKFKLNEDSSHITHKKPYK